MNKKFLSLVLALVMVLGTFGNVFAAAATDKKEVKEVPKLTTTEAKAKWLIDNKYVVGTADKDGKPTGDMDLKSPIRRDAVSKMLVFAIGEQDLAAKLQGVYTPFPDVKVDNIMNGFIAAAASSTANGVPLIVGYEDGMFRPTNNVTYAELAKMLVVAIDKDLTPAVAKTYSWPQGWMDRAARLGIFEGLSIADANKPAVRSDAFAMIYNAFYQLKELKAVPANEFRGIISEQSNGTKVVLNQGEFKKEFKVNESTVFVKDTSAKEPNKWIKSFNSNYYVGSLVRVLFDKDGVATHIIEMGNPVELGKNAPQAWVDLGKIQLKVANSNKATRSAAAEEVRLNDEAVRFVTQAKKFDVTSKTVFYIADADNGVLTQVKDYAAAKALVGNKTTDVYVGYEYLNQSKTNEAKIVVFNHVKPDTNLRTVRVTAAVSNAEYKLLVQAPGYESTTVEGINKRNDDQNWPYNYSLDADDILGVGASGNVKKLLDASEAPVVKVNKLLKYEDGKATEVERLADANAIEFVDKKHMGATYDLPTDYKAFFGKEVVKGANVQLILKGKKIDVISVVNKRELKGELTVGKLYDTRVKTGIVEKINKKQGLIDRIFINVEGEGVLEYVTTDSGFKVGDLVDYRVTGFNRNDTQPEVVLAKVVKKATQIAYEEAFAKLPAEDKITDANYDATKAPALKADIEAAVAKYNAMNSDAKVEQKVKDDAKAELNKIIAKYNGLAAAASDQITAL